MRLERSGVSDDRQVRVGVSDLDDDSAPSDLADGHGNAVALGVLDRVRHQLRRHARREVEVGANTKARRSLPDEGPGTRCAFGAALEGLAVFSRGFPIPGNGALDRSEGINCVSELVFHKPIAAQRRRRAFGGFLKSLVRRRLASETTSRKDAPKPGGGSVVTENLRIEIRPGDEAQLVTLGGELDMAVEDEVFETLTSVTGSKVIVDLSGVTFLDSSGLCTLIAAKGEIERRGHNVEIRGAQRPVRRVFELCWSSHLLAG